MLTAISTLHAGFIVFVHRVIIMENRPVDSDNIHGSHRPISFRPVAPVAYQVIVEPGIGQFREFEPRRVHARMNSLGLFLVHKLTCGKRESAR